MISSYYVTDKSGQTWEYKIQPKDAELLKEFDAWREAAGATQLDPQVFPLVWRAKVRRA